MSHILERPAAEDALLVEAGVDRDCKVAELRKDDRTRLLDVLTQYTLPVGGHQGYRKAEVTGGGVALEELDTSKMESRQVCFHF